LKKARTVAVLMVSLAVVYIASGCAMLQRGPSDEQLLSELLHGWQAAMEQGDVDKLMSFYSESYVGGDGSDYATTKERMEQIVPMLEQIEAEFSSAETQIQIEGDKATLAPISVESSYGAAEITLIATKEAPGMWRITSSEMER